MQPNQYTTGHTKTNVQWLTEQIQVCNPTDCLIWPFTTGTAGYGVVWFDKKRNVRAHRLAFFLFYGAWPEPQGLHICDIKLCVNPYHVTEGTHSDNMADKISRNRCARGESNGTSKLTEEFVKQIRKDVETRSMYSIAKAYGVCLGTISSVVKRKTWGHI